MLRTVCGKCVAESEPFHVPDATSPFRHTFFASIAYNGVVTEHEATTKGTILIVDDHERIVDVLRQYALHDGYDVVTAADGRQALDLFSRTNPDLILLDVAMPEIDGFEVCRRIRETSDVPIIMVTARGEDFERIMGLDIGADDYIVKPFSPGEVMARVRALLRRIARQTEATAVRLGTLEIKSEAHEAEVDGIRLRLTKREFELLQLFAARPNHVFSRDDLLNLIWGYDYFGDNRTVDSHIKRLRAKLGTAGLIDWQIETVWGVGYKFSQAESEER
ncbi:MAG TPA: response regulator transcription factor [Fastidiosipila sp.]|jgi:DNA-binding response OmpR family regulator|nr:response regulator transcription factor [Fastidiosipila sp.]